MIGNLAGRRIIVSGAASGIGEAAARRCAEAGADVAIVDLDEAGATAIAGQIGARARAIRADIADEQSVADAVAQASAFLGGVDGLVNCAGVVGTGALAEMPLAAWNRVIAVNLTGTFLMSRAVLPLMTAAKGGAIVNISSNQALRPEAMLAGYAAAKAGVVALTRSLAAEVAPMIRVNCVCPGTIDTPMSRAVIPSDQPIENNAMRRRGTPDEIANMILFLLSADSDFTTGATIAIDGGRTFY